jgi:hypothetical protein
MRSILTILNNIYLEFLNKRPNLLIDLTKIEPIGDLEELSNEPNKLLLID